MKDNKITLPIGFFDSGVGGIALLKEAVALMPFENFLYYGDSINVPYGNKAELEIKTLSLSCGDFLFRKGVKAIVMACNTATSISVQIMRELYRIPVISIEPAVKPAVDASTDGYVLVLATPATISQQRYNSLLEKIGSAEKIINVPLSRLAQMIEKMDLDGPEIKEYLRENLLPYRGKKIDGIVLGCTHYSFISTQIQKTAKELFAGACEIFDGKTGTVRQLKRVLDESGLLNTQNDNPTVSFQTSGDSFDIELYKRFFTF
jgi:glutamate racemase